MKIVDTTNIPKGPVVGKILTLDQSYDHVLTGKNITISFPDGITSVNTKVTHSSDPININDSKTSSVYIENLDMTIPVGSTIELRSE
jgi:hypothetical protein